jgi:beta-glucanase (GH16 family)
MIQLSPDINFFGNCQQAFCILRSNCILILTIFSMHLHASAQIKPSEGASGKYTRLVWQDEFDKPGLPDSDNWKYDTGYLRNHEWQFYTYRRTENAEIKNGFLDIIARNDSFKTGGQIHPVTSADISTHGKKSWTYGRIEVRAKIPSSLGTWPAIWTLGDDIRQTGWPACGEIDIMEHVGFMPDTLHFNVHTAKYNHVKKTNKGTRIFYPSPEKDFHIYAIEWFPERIDWLLDGKKVFTYINEHSGEATWPFDKPQFIILNLAIGGDWGGAKGVSLNALPQHFYIDYVRVYQ